MPSAFTSGISYGTFEGVVICRGERGKLNSGLRYLLFSSICGNPILDMLRLCVVGVPDLLRANHHERELRLGRLLVTISLPP
jgi:hypothetical protein